MHENSLVCAGDVEFRSQLFELKHLKFLSFFSCFLSPHQHPITIPDKKWLNLADSLESLEFRSNPGLIDHVPTSIGELAKLQSLVLLENGLTGQLPQNIGNLTKLKRLVLAGNSFAGEIQDSFGYLPDLLIVDLSRNSLSGHLPMSLGGLTSLLKLDLSNNQLQGTIPTEIGNLKNLTLLDLSNNKFSGGLIQALQEMYSLTELVLSNNSIGGDLMSVEWGYLQDLVILDLSSLGLTGEIPESMAKLKKLRFLGLSNNFLTGNLSPKLVSLPLVGRLYINGNNLTGELQLSQWFYRKMGRRFGAWNNPNLCYPVGVMSTNYKPYGVKPCQQEVTLSEPNYTTKWVDRNVNQSSFSITSLGFSSRVCNGFSWIFLVVIFMILPDLHYFP